MSELLLVDTSVLVALERGKLSPEVLAKGQPGARLAISAITASELLHAWHRARTPSQRGARERFLLALFSELAILAFDLPVARVHAGV
ncbi:MAG TPA: PIN domain-containing protein [Terriglobia bacterium]|nr:PIN domain-containing protein [Terriglobia bacterium]